MRFDNDTENWRQNLLSELSTSTGGGTPSTKIKEYWKGNIGWISSSDLQDDNVSQISVTRFISNDAIINSSTKICPPNTIHIVSRVGVGKVAISKESLCTSQDFVNLIDYKLKPLFLTYQLQCKIKEMIKSTQGTSIKGLTTKEINLIKLFYPNKDVQEKISNFFSLLDQRINTQSKIIEDLECQINYIRRKLFTGYINDDIYNQKYIFNKIFISYKKLNEQSLQQYTIGKNGIKSMSNHLNYFINSHIVFMPNTLILGIGIDEIGVSIDTTGCCSPIYKTYKINNEIVDTLFLNIFANDYFSIIKNRVTQKSTRREFEFDYKELAKTLFTLPDIKTQKRDAQIVNKFYFKLQKEKDILELYKKQKAYLLKNMFI